VHVSVVPSGFRVSNRLEVATTSTPLTLCSRRRLRTTSAKNPRLKRTRSDMLFFQAPYVQPVKADSKRDADYLNRNTSMLMVLGLAVLVKVGRWIRPSS
jgi:hypothetical protein